MVAPSNGGKSNLLKNMLLRPEFGYRLFHRSKTGALDTLCFLAVGSGSCLDSLVDQLPKFPSYLEWDDAVIRDIMEYSRNKTQRGVLLFLDDMITDTRHLINSGNILNELAFMGRHHKVSFILRHDPIPPFSAIRINTSAVIAFNLKNKRRSRHFWKSKACENIGKCTTCHIPKCFCISTKRQERRMPILRGYFMMHHDRSRKIGY